MVVCFIACRLRAINSDQTSWEDEPLANLANMGEVMALCTVGFGSLWIQYVIDPARIFMGR